MCVHLLSCRYARFPETLTRKKSCDFQDRIKNGEVELNARGKPCNGSVPIVRVFGGVPVCSSAAQPLT